MLRFLALVVMVGSILASLYTGGEPFGPGVSELERRHQRQPRLRRREHDTVAPFFFY